MCIDYGDYEYSSKDDEHFLEFLKSENQNIGKEIPVTGSKTHPEELDFINDCETNFIDENGNLTIHNVMW